MIKAEGLTYTYSGGTKIAFPDFTIQPGEECLIIGSSGCGKTTLLHLLSGLLKLKDGTLEINGSHYSDMSAYKTDRFRGKHIGLVFQESHFISSLTVLDNLLLAQKLAGIKKDKSAALHLLDKLQLNERAQYLPQKLSIGERQRASIARAIVHNPDYILADEPTSALDDENAERVLSLLREQAKARNSALIIVTHDSRLKDKISKKIEL